MAVVETFKALGDPVRLEMMRRLASGSAHTVGGVSSGLGLSRQGARKHLTILVEAKLVVLEPKGRETEVRLDHNSLDAARAFIAELEGRWERRLEALRDFAEREDSTKP